MNTKTMKMVFLVVALSAIATKVVYAQDECAPPALSAPDSWLPTTPQPGNDKPDPHPAPDCPFYKAAWQRFLVATQPDTNGVPKFLSYATIEDVFGHDVAPQFAKESGGLLSLAPRSLESPNQTPAIGAGVRQAVSRGLLLDQNGHPVFYAIHMNPEFVKFLADNHLHDKDQLISADDQLKFRPGVMELKSAWQIVDDDSPLPDYITARARIPILTLASGELKTTVKTREVRVALLAIHVVFALEDHPEMIWSTFEHINKDGIPDTAPTASANPSKIVGDPVLSNSGFTLYRAGTVACAANRAYTDKDLAEQFNEQTQTFDKGGSIFQTSVYRLFPGSKSDGHQASDSAPDGEVESINHHMRALFGDSKVSATDKRQFYRLVGAVWLDNPTTTFMVGHGFQNKNEESTDDKGAVIAGEGRLSSTAMESFTQSESDFPNCFSCHDTARITDDTPGNVGKTILKPKLLNVSHILSKFVSGVGAISGH
jgi:hypothetical protein